MQKLGENRTESFANFFTMALIAKKGYREGCPPEAGALLAACDRVVSRADGLSLDIVGIVDRENNPQRRFSLTKEELEQIGIACRRYTGKVGFQKLPVSIRIIEAGWDAPTEEDVQRLKRLRSRLFFTKVRIFAWAVRTVDLTVAPAGWGLTMMQAFVRRVMKGREHGVQGLVPPKHPVTPDETRPLVTYALLALLTAIFAAEYLFRASSPSGALDPSIETLVALGALDRSLVVEDGEWWRLLTGPLLHGGLVHLIMNGLALFFAGAVLENVIGRAWFLSIFVLSGLCGAFFSLWLNAGNLISVGASGAIMGLFAAAFAISYRYPSASAMRTFLQSGSLRVLIPSLIPLADGLFGLKIDFSAHLGGAVAGAILGGGLAAIWRRDSALPPFRVAAWGVGALGLAGAIYGGAQIASTYREHAITSQLIPDGELSSDIEAAKRASPQLVAQYPRDPRSHMYRALSLLDDGALAAAEIEWEAALREKTALERYFKPELKRFILAEYALTLSENGKKAEAKAMAEPVCGVPGQTRDALAKQGLCP